MNKMMKHILTPLTDKIPGIIVRKHKVIKSKLKRIFKVSKTVNVSGLMRRLMNIDWTGSIGPYLNIFKKIGATLLNPLINR
jgi:hypothetical protein